MTVEERILDISQRLARELTQDKDKVSKDRDRLSEELDQERRRLSKQLEAKRSEVDAVRRALGLARNRIHAVSAELDDEVLQLNVGGYIFSTRRSTLCLYEGSYLANLFSGRWESSIERDGEGRFFLDFDPASFRLLLNFLRSKRLENGQTPLPPPAVAPEQEERFRNLVEYLGLADQLQEAEAVSEGRAAALAEEAAKARAAQPLGTTLLNSASSLISAIRSRVPATPPQPSAASAAPATGGLTASAAPATGSHPMQPHRAADPMQSHRAAAGPALAGVGAATNGLPVGGAVSSGASVSGAVASGPSVGHWAGDTAGADAGATSSRKTPGWSRKCAHQLAVADDDDQLRVRIADTRSLAAAAAVRATRGFQTGRHSWQVTVEESSDWSYVGFVSQAWAATSNPVGRAAHSWGIASNGVAYASREEVGRLQQYRAGSRIGFFVNMDSPDRPVTIIIDGKEYPDVFRDLPTPVYPAVSNCRSPARYYLHFAAEADQD